jgi:hypothetical protein
MPESAAKKQQGESARNRSLTDDPARARISLLRRSALNPRGQLSAREHERDLSHKETRRTVTRTIV